MSKETKLGETELGPSYHEQECVQNNIEDGLKKTDTGENEDEMDLSLAREIEMSKIKELRQEIEKMTSLPCPVPSRSLVKKMIKFDYKLERAVMRMAELGTIDEEIDNNPGALSEVEKETVLPEVSRSKSEVADKNPGALTEVWMETVLPVVSQKKMKKSE